MQVEPSLSRLRPSNKVQIRNLPSHVNIEEIQELVASYGPVQKCELVGAEDLVYVTFENPDTAQMAVQGLNNVNFQGSTIKVDFAHNRTARRLRMNNIGMQGGQNAGNQGAVELPLRIVVGSEFIGAIIGRSGQTIQNITKQTRARVDIHRSEMAMSPETVITIKGTPESCSNACFEIMKIVQSEAQSLMKGKGPQDELGSERDHPYKILCPNELCGRIIGKSGSIIKSFMEQSESHIAVSSIQDTTYYADRVVTITGPLENCKKAEALVMEKIRKCAEMDQQNSQNMGLYGGMPPRGPIGMASNFYQGGRGLQQLPYQMQAPNGVYPGDPGLYGVAPPPPPQQQLEVTYLYIPESTVGAVIGTKGSSIKNIMRLSNARIKISDPNRDKDDRQERGSSRNEDQRKVIITGPSDAQWKAQFHIVEKIKTETMAPTLDDVHMWIEILVPKSTIGRIIGKGGQHVKEMQRVTGATVKTPDTQSVPDDAEVPVSILGNFYESQSAQHCIRSLLNQSNKGPSGDRPRPNGRPAINGN